MRISGHWGKFDAPYVTGILISEDFGIRQPVMFLLDTGASRTTILDNDAARLNVNYKKLRKSQQATVGIGGAVDTYVIPDARLMFMTEKGYFETEPDLIFVLKHAIRDAVTGERIKNIPSILGRDILNKYKLILDRNNNTVLITDEEVAL